MNIKKKIYELLNKKFQEYPGTWYKTVDSIQIVKDEIENFLNKIKITTFSVSLNLIESNFNYDWYSLNITYLNEDKIETISEKIMNKHSLKKVKFYNN